MDTITVQGRLLGKATLVEIQELVDANPSWSRRRIAGTLVERWDWRNGAGRLKDMSCRLLLAKLAERGLVRLPTRRCAPLRRKSRSIAAVEIDQSAVEGPLELLRPLWLERVTYGTQVAQLFDGLLSHHHYLGYAYPVGANVRYLARSADGRVVACAVWSSAVLKVACRDVWIGWSPEQRTAKLVHIANNSRFCILPWVRVPHLASHLLGLMMRQLCVDWPAITGAHLALAETFVDAQRFHGTCYRAANWLDLGRTKGRTRDDRAHSISVPIKQVLILPVWSIKRIRRELAG